ncbi:DUF4386 domain-containing protein [Dokdonella soli]|uniref:DUF4386 domain-containing protein n=1 Tax=Dokdonella soli TaxID=529810 RepID=A0ABN1IEM8_9GAMM
MSNHTIDESQRRTARVAGFTFLFAIAIVILANYGINFRLIVPGNAAETARNIMAHETLFRLNIACNLIYVVTVVVLLAALYVILKPVNQNLALVAAFCRLVFALMWGVTALNTLGALRLLGDAAYLPVFRPDQLQTLARLHIAASYDAYYVGLPFWGLASTACSYLWFKSRYIPRALAAFGVISSAWCVFCAFAFLVFPHFDAKVNASWFDLPMVIFEMALGLWLLVKGLSPSGLAGADRASNRAQPGAA